MLECYVFYHNLYRAFVIRAAKVAIILGLRESVFFISFENDVILSVYQLFL